MDVLKQIEDFLKEEEEKRQRVLTDLDNKIKNRTVTADLIAQKVSDLQAQVGELEKSLREKEDVHLNFMASQNSELDARKKKISDEEERIRAERNGLNVDKSLFEQQRAASEKTLSDNLDKIKRVKQTLEELNKVL